MHSPKPFTGLVRGWTGRCPECWGKPQWRKKRAQCVLAVSLDREYRLIVLPRSFRVQRLLPIPGRKVRFKSWFNVQKIARRGDTNKLFAKDLLAYSDCEQWAAVSAFMHRLKDREPLSPGEWAYTTIGWVWVANSRELVQTGTLSREPIPISIVGKVVATARRVFSAVVERVRLRSISFGGNTKAPAPTV